MLNKVMLIGRLGRDPELRYTQAGVPVTSLNLATDENYVDKDGNRVERTEWHRVSVFQRTAESCSQYLSKGSLVYVEGKLQTKKWQDQQGQDRYTTEIRADRVLFLDKKGDRSAQGFQGDDAPSEPSYSRPAPAPRRAPAQRNPAPEVENYGSPFPSEASDMDDTPF